MLWLTYHKDEVCFSPCLISPVWNDLFLQMVMTRWCANRSWASCYRSEKHFGDLCTRSSPLICAFDKLLVLASAKQPKKLTAWSRFRRQLFPCLHFPHGRLVPFPLLGKVSWSVLRFTVKLILSFLCQGQSQDWGRRSPLMITLLQASCLKCVKCKFCFSGTQLFPEYIHVLELK